MRMKHPVNLNECWASLIVEELVRQGVRCFSMAPGSRSAPLALAVADHPATHPVIHFDERGAAFYALGHARATGIPSVWITTSGTAVANGLPAIVEAAMDGVPFIALTADRPPELRDTRANQTIDQPRLFTAYTKWNVDLPCPDPAISPRYVLTTVGQAVDRSRHGFPGPVHLNAMFREPLAPSPDGHDLDPLMDTLKDWLASGTPYGMFPRCAAVPALDGMDALRNRLAGKRSGVMVIGRLGQARDREAVRQLANRLQWPVLPDILSGLRLGQPPSTVIPFVDQILLAPEQAPAADIILQIGDTPVSKRIHQWMAGQRAERVTVKPHPYRQDIDHVGGLQITCAASEFVAALGLGPSGSDWPASESLEWWRRANDRVDQALSGLRVLSDELDEMFIAHHLSRALSADWTLFAGNSMPVRDLDMYAAPTGAAIPVAANRGASGIDGTIATACGWARGVGRPTVLLLGDLAFLHDLNSLQLVRNSDTPVVVVVVNNDGGGIFSFLPVAEQADHFEACFGAPHGLSFGHAARLFDVPYILANTREDYDRGLRKALKDGKSMILEVRTDRARNRDRHRDLQAQISRMLRTG